MKENTGNFKFFENKSCEYFPCHQYPKKHFNCLFCYCPLYPYENCGGNYKLLPNGTKDCSSCYIPHKPENYDYIVHTLIELQNQHKGELI